MTIGSAGQGRDKLRIYAEWYGEVEKALSGRGRYSDRERRRWAMAAFVLAVMLAPAAAERTS